MHNNPDKGRAGKRKTRNEASPSNKTTSAEKTCFLHGPGHSSGECKLLKEYSKKYASQHPHKYNQAHSGSKTNRGNSVEFDSSIKDASIMEHGDPIPKKKMRGQTSQKRKSEIAKLYW